MEHQQNPRLVSVNAVTVTESNEYIYICMVLIGLILIICSIKLHFDTYDSESMAVKATVTDIECNRYIKNRIRDLYKCKINIRYVINNRSIDNILITEGKVVHDIGDELMVYVDRANPVNVYAPYMSDDLLILVLSTLGVLIILFTLSTRFLYIR